MVLKQLSNESLLRVVLWVLGGFNEDFLRFLKSVFLIF
jgi:hypothetical protein